MLLFFSHTFLKRIKTFVFREFLLESSGKCYVMLAPYAITGNFGNSSRAINALLYSILFKQSDMYLQ